METLPDSACFDLPGLQLGSSDQQQRDHITENNINLSPNGYERFARRRRDHPQLRDTNVVWRLEIDFPGEKKIG